MTYPEWWNVKAKNVARLKHHDITTTKELMLAACKHNDITVDDPTKFTMAIEDLFSFCNSHLNNLSMRLKNAGHEEPLTLCIQGKKPNTTITYIEPPSKAKDAFGNPFGFSKEDIDNFPEECYCPISCEVFKDAVVAVDGYTYERKSFEAWVTKQQRSPLTGEVLTTKDVIPNKIMMAYIHRISS